MKLLITRIIKPIIQSNWYTDLTFAVVRFVTGMLLTIDFGASKFGMPWSTNELSLFQVSDWFIEDVSKFGGIFTLFPGLFAWLAAGSEAIGGLFLAIGFKTRIAAFFIICTMLGAIFLQKWPAVLEQGVWPILPALGFLWVGLYNFLLGSGRFGVDYIISKKLRAWN